MELIGFGILLVIPFIIYVVAKQDKEFEKRIVINLCSVFRYLNLFFIIYIFIGIVNLIILWINGIDVIGLISDTLKIMLGFSI